MEGGSIPAALHQLASQHDVSVGQLRQDTLSPAESSALLLSLAGLPPGVVQRLEELQTGDELIAGQLCYGAIEGCWSPLELGVLLAAPSPQRVLLGAAPVWDTLLHSKDRFYADGAVLAGRFVEMLARSSVVLRAPADEAAASSKADAGQLEETEDATIDLRTHVDPGLVSIAIEPRRESDELLFKAPIHRTEVVRSRALELLLRPLDHAALPEQIESDISSIEQRSGDDAVSFAILVPGDFGYIPQAEQQRLVAAAEAAGALIVADQAGLVEIYEEADRRIARVATRLDS